MLSRFMAVSALSIVAIAGVRYYGNASASPQQNVFPEEQSAALEGPERERYEQLRDFAMRRAAYAQLAERLVRALEAGAMSLSDATERLFYFCLQNYPEHLECVAFAEPGGHIKTKLARNLVRGCHLPSLDGGANPATADAAARLDCELRELPYDADSTAKLERH